MISSQQPARHSEPDTAHQPLVYRRQQEVHRADGSCCFPHCSVDPAKHGEERVEETPPDNLVIHKVAAKMATMWADPAIQTIYKTSTSDASAYFAHIERICACEGYLPTSWTSSRRSA